MKIHRRIFWRTLVALMTVMATAIPFSLVAQAAPQDIYDDTLHGDNWSWGTSVDYDDSHPTFEGARSMAVRYNEGWAGLSLRIDEISSDPGGRLEFALHPSTGEFPGIDVSVYDESGYIRHVNAAAYANETSDGWYHVSIPLADLGAADTTIYRVQLQNLSASPQPTFNVDDLKITDAGSNTSASDDRLTSDDESASSGPRASSSGSYPTGSFRPSGASEHVDDAIREAVAKYNLPRWFYYAVVQRESSFNPSATNGDDVGLTQLGGPYYYGERYPNYLDEPDNYHRQYGWDMMFAKYGMWVKMDQVSPLSDPFDAQQNLDRFSSGYAVPLFNLFKERYGEGNTETLRRVVFHWNKGLNKSYDSGNQDYLGLYDQYVERFKPTVEAEDGVWDGRPTLP